MRTSVSLAAAVFLFLLLTAMEAEAIRLDAESRAAVSQSQQQTVNQEVAPGKSSVGESETKRSIAGQEVVRATTHKLPEFHEDYYGASVHEPRHH
uniref:Uncharacterized protein n=1 Tax=Setaria italica TaxID=4555 RepID=K3YYB2_SETIT